MKSVTQAATIANLKLLLKGIEVNIPADMPLMVRAVRYTPVTLSAVIQRRLDALEAVLTARAELQAAIAEAKAVDAETAPFLSSLRTILRAMFETDPQVLGELGITARKIPAKPTSMQLLERALKAKATRAARHTMGPRQRAAIKGRADPVIVDAPALPGVARLRRIDDVDAPALPGVARLRRIDDVDD